MQLLQGLALGANPCAGLDPTCEGLVLLLVTAGIVRRAQNEAKENCIAKVPQGRKLQPGDIAIIALHASSFQKETYESLWEDLISNLSGDVGISGV